MSNDRRLAAAERAYLEARSIRDRLDVARVRGATAEARSLEPVSAAAFASAREALEALDARDPGLDDGDRRAMTTMTESLEAAEAYALPGVTVHGGDDEAPDLEAAYAAAADSLVVDGRTVTRPQVLARLATEPDAHRRRSLFLALDPLWRAVDGDGDETSPYRALLARSAATWRSGDSPIVPNAFALGVDPDDITAWVETALAGWRTAVVEPARARGEPPVEPWDWWWQAGEAQRSLESALPLAALQPVNRAVHASLGADLDALAVDFDVHPRSSRPPVPVAFTTFGSRPHGRMDGTWDPGRPTVLETLTEGGLGELTELIHETGHAIHIAGIRTRPAFADWPDSDAFTEALAELVTLDVTDPAWQRRWLPGGIAVSEAAGLRARSADIALDAAWALFEIRLHAAPERRPNDVWTEITGTWLGVAPHPEWSWWAMRGQLVDAPGYMANYAIGAVLAADLRAAIRGERGDWIDGDPGWYGWVREHVYRFGRERATRDVLEGVLGRSPTSAALLAEMTGTRTR